MYSYVTYGVKLHNILMVLMEISLILELWIFFLKINTFGWIKKNNENRNSVFDVLCADVLFLK